MDLMMWVLSGRWCMWIWKSVWGRIWYQHSSFEHSPFQQRREVRSLLPDPMLREQMVLAWLS